MRLVFMGTPAFAVPSLNVLAASSHTLVGVFSQPPRPAGRGYALTPSPVHSRAAELGLPVFNPEKLKGEALDQLAALQPELIVVVAYGLILSGKVLALAPCLNVHPSALPRWRGAAPLQRSVMAGDTTTDVCIMALEKTLDTGPVYLRKPYAIGADETAGQLHDRLAVEGANALREVVDTWAHYSTRAVPQGAEGITYAEKITAADRPVNFHQPARLVVAQIHGLSPSPGATCTIGGHPLKLLTARVADGHGAPGTVLAAEGALRIACADGAIEVLTLQREGKKAMPAAAFLRGSPIAPGTVAQ